MNVDRVVGITFIGCALALLAILSLSIVQGEQLSDIEKRLYLIEQQEEEEDVQCSTIKEYRWYGIVKSEDVSCGIQQ